MHAGEDGERCLRAIEGQRSMESCLQADLDAFRQFESSLKTDRLTDLSSSKHASTQKIEKA